MEGPGRLLTTGGVRPMLICDIMRNRAKVINKCVILSARVVEYLRDNSSSQTYVIDDTTATAEITISRDEKDAAEILRLENELQAMKAKGTHETNQQVLKCLLRILNQIKQTFTKLTVGQKVLVLGKPYIRFKKVRIKALSVCRDERFIRSMEIEMKDLLISMYTNE